MLRHRQSGSRLWMYVVAAFLAGVLFSYIILPRGGQSVGNSWQELERRRVDDQQILNEGQMEIAASGKHKKKLRAVVGVQVSATMQYAFLNVHQAFHLLQEVLITPHPPSQFLSLSQLVLNMSSLLCFKVLAYFSLLS